MMTGLFACGVWLPMQVALIYFAQGAMAAELAGTTTQDEKNQDDFVLAVHCDKPGELTRVADLRQKIEQLDKTLPNIPPDEAKYLEKEDDVVMRMGSPDKMSPEDRRIVVSRWFALRSRRLYYAWKVRGELARAQIAVNAIDDPDHIPTISLEVFLSGSGVAAQTWPRPVRNEPADRIYRMIGVLTPLAALADGMSAFLSNEAIHRDRLLTKQQEADSSLALLALSYDLDGALSCDFLKYAFKHR